MNIKNKQFLTHGKRGFIYTGLLNGKKIVIKSKNPNSLAEGRIKNEYTFLKILNKHKIGPKLIKFSNNSIIYYYVKGEFILDYIEKNEKKKIISILKEILKQCFILDKLKINKLEMHFPIKHIIIDKKPVLIDFERCYFTENPKNVTQFCQFLMSIKELLVKKKININEKEFIKILKEYKSKQNNKNFKKIIKLI
ncbi:MAG: hypothetical protein PHF86_06040 [Candidatus Nanoarchaeia archaeon]|nr:hypothetical protein [Candidatus Nanoarchaeia archaeon]